MNLLPEVRLGPRNNPFNSGGDPDPESGLRSGTLRQIYMSTAGSCYDTCGKQKTYVDVKYVLW